MIKYLMIIGLFFCNVKAKEFGFVTSVKDEKGRFFYKVTSCEELKEELKDINLLKIGKDLTEFPLSGVRKKFIVQINDKWFVLTMLSYSLLDGLLSDDKIFHLREVEEIDNKLYTKDGEKRIFASTKLWDQLDLFLKNEK